MKTPDSSAPIPAEPIAVVLGYAEIEVRTVSGGSETVRLRLLRIAEFPRFFALLEQEETIAEFLAEKPEGWAATVATASIVEIIEKGMDLNFTTAQRWATRRLALGTAAAPFAKYLRSAIPQPSPSSAPTSG